MSAPRYTRQQRQAIRRSAWAMKIFALWVAAALGVIATMALFASAGLVAWLLVYWTAAALTGVSLVYSIGWMVHDYAWGLGPVSSTKRG